MVCPGQSWARSTVREMFKAFLKASFVFMVSGQELLQDMNHPMFKKRADFGTLSQRNSFTRLMAPLACLAYFLLFSSC